ncbi:uncharacterized protein LOC132201171 [Neocloeon triangulifer]|uniref:uncharacterized protein LOC132201171 n=1 Tax=Neocloeon triangulifer TaxID=2078957 RepID=UPI00286F8444|nr:uncharacterized protein LOC132201171 [Neocloeon triangulifer]
MEMVDQLACVVHAFLSMEKRMRDSSDISSMLKVAQNCRKRSPVHEIVKEIHRHKEQLSLRLEREFQKLIVSKLPLMKQNKFSLIVEQFLLDELRAETVLMRRLVCKECKHIVCQPELSPFCNTNDMRCWAGFEDPRRSCLKERCDGKYIQEVVLNESCIWIDCMSKNSPNRFEEMEYLANNGLMPSVLRLNEKEFTLSGALIREHRLGDADFEPEECDYHHLGDIFLHQPLEEEYLDISELGSKSVDQGNAERARTYFVERQQTGTWNKIGYLNTELWGEPWEADVENCRFPGYPASRTPRHPAGRMTLLAASLVTQSPA